LRRRAFFAFLKYAFPICQRAWSQTIN